MTAKYGSSISFDVSANQGSTIKLIAGCEGELKNEKYVISPVTQSCDLTAQFEKKTYTVTANISDKSLGSVSSLSQIAKHGNTASFTSLP
ncbi:hypothetical protein PSECIP111951_00691 [Pseudoalteromonas holothuriae]|uniref:Uncharacterized protein n=1 Tax=Pseudoalteromonas holothuriae TaxID=2963714 RepID=A0A9W4QWW2_9GAMM|nr:MULTISPECIES: hypothetical protein [unclassified Pseudoalteromonas]CAH9052798.1 hypothetical protein PSECIP111951_00691 [Pseudoalteromonas sp. CIP111951]CAH9056725.1 hypothetical protein PSECIP111854_01851 [Pseudoalteromonas sp. CIP111854]